MIAKSSIDKRQKSKSLRQKAGKIISFLHLWLGLATGSVLVVVALTGCILSFEDELTPIIYSKEQKVKPEISRLPVDSLIAIAKNTYPKKKIFRIYIPADKERSFKITFGTKKKGYDYLFINQYNGKILSKGKENKRFFPTVLNIHRFLLADTVGKTITGISCAITLFMAISGVYLWWPKNKKILKQRLKVKTDASFKRVNWDLHAVSGFYAMIFLVLITLTGLIWSFTWIEDLMFKITDGKKEKTEIVKDKPANVKKATDLYENVVSITNKTYTAAGEVMITFPDKKGKPFTVSKEDLSSKFYHVNQLYLDSRTAEVIKIAPFESLSLGSKMRKLNKPLHTGSIFGLPTKILIFFTALITAILPITGFIIWYGRGKKNKNKF